MAIELTVEYKRLNAFFADYTKNIGRGGTFIRTEKPLPIGTEFTFKLVVPTLLEPLRIRGRVQWIAQVGDPNHDAGMGIGFLFDDEAQRLKLSSTVENLMQGSLGLSLTERLLARRDV